MPAERNTATFVPYFWEAYNEIVQPRRFDHYLITKWAKELGPIGFLVVKTLRDRCYHNPDKGVLRDTCEIRMDELAPLVGVSERTIQREFKTNEALGMFVRKTAQCRMVNGHPEQIANLYQVCMDDPIHPDDYEHYDELRAQKEADRSGFTAGKKKKMVERQFDAQGGSAPTVERQIVAVERQYVTPPMSDNMSPQIDNLPFGDLFTKESLTPVPVDSPPINPPEGETGEGRVWAVVLTLLAAQVGSGEINAPTWHGHLTRLRLASLTDTPDGVRAVIVAPSAFTRDWVEKRQGDRLKAALACVLKREPATMTVEFRGEGK